MSFTQFSTTNSRAQGSPILHHKPPAFMMLMMLEIDRLRSVSQESYQLSEPDMIEDDCNDSDSDEDDVPLKLVIRSEYDRRVGSLSSKNSKDKRRKKQTAADYFINEEIHKNAREQQFMLEEVMRCEMIQQWRTDTQIGIAYWTNERKEMAKVHPEMFILWKRWESWVPPPPISTESRAQFLAGEIACVVGSRWVSEMLESWCRQKSRHKKAVVVHKVKRFSNMNRDELIVVCKEKGLSVVGNKRVLLQRIKKTKGIPKMVQSSHVCWACEEQVNIGEVCMSCH